MLRHALVIVACVALLGACASVPERRSAVLYEGARVIRGDGTAPVENAAFLVEHGVIAQLGRRGELTLPPGARRIDLTGKTVMPTLVSTHVHPGFQRGLTYAAENYTYDNIVADLNRALYFGVATVMSQGIEKGDLTYRVRADQQTGRVGGARLKIAGRGIGAPNAGPGAPAYANIAYEVSTETEIRQAVRELAASGVDGIKIWVDDRGGRAPRLAPELFRPAIDEGHRHRLRVAAHVFYHADAVDLAEARIDSFAHLVRDKVMDDKLIAQVVERSVYVMPNLGGGERNRHRTAPAWMDEPYLAGMLEDTVAPSVVARMRASFAAREPAAAERAAKGYAILESSLAKLDAAGALIILGCDTGLEDHFFGYAEQKELELMVAAGMSPMNVIIAATSRSAQYLGATDTGQLTPGRRADFLVLDANPVEDIRNTRRIAAIYVGGALVDRAALRLALQKPNNTGGTMTNLDRCYNIFDLREAAQRRLPKGIFEYVDKGTEDGISLDENRAAFQRIKLRTRFLNDWSKRDLGTEIFGKRIELPFGIAPTGSAGLMWYQGEVELAKAAAAAGIPFTLAMGALTSMEEVSAKVPEARKWFQLYPWADEAGSYEMVTRARDLGWEALVVTIDAAPGRGREHNERNGFSFPFRPNVTAAVDMAMHPAWVWRVMRKYLMNEGLPTNANFPDRYRHTILDGKTRTRPKPFQAMTWEHIRKFRDFWPRKLIVKSILSADQARAAVDAGADGIVVSNHGGRAFDSAVATIDILPEVVEAVGDRCTVILDSGVRRGSDIVKALALGAKMVLVGRATLYGTACGGQAGAARAIQILAGEMERSFGYVGARSVAEIGPHIFAHQTATAPATGLHDEPNLRVATS